jgi:hypothetical protein
MEPTVSEPRSGAIAEGRTAAAGRLRTAALRSKLGMERQAITGERMFYTNIRSPVKQVTIPLRGVE